MQCFRAGGFRFRVGDIGQLEPGAVIHPIFIALHLGFAVFVATAHLRGQIVGVGVEIALGAAIGGSAFHGIEPSRKTGVFFPQRVAFVVVKAGVHPFDVGGEDDICGAKLFQEVRAGGASEGLFHHGNHLGKLVSAALVLLGRSRRIAQPGTPGAKEQSFQLPQGEDSGVFHAQTQRAVNPFEGNQNVIAFGDNPIVEGDRR